MNAITFDPNALYSLAELSDALNVSEETIIRRLGCPVRIKGHVAGADILRALHHPAGESCSDADKTQDTANLDVLEHIENVERDLGKRPRRGRPRKQPCADVRDF